MFTVLQSITGKAAQAEALQLQSDLEALQSQLQEAEATHAAAHAAAEATTQAPHVRNLVRISRETAQIGHHAGLHAADAAQAVADMQRGIDKKRRKLKSLQAVLALDNDLAAARQALEKATATRTLAQQAHDQHKTRSANLAAAAESARAKLDELLGQVAAGDADPITLAAAQAQVSALDALLPRLPVEGERLAEELSTASSAQAAAERGLRSVQARIALIELKEGLAALQNQASEYLRLSGAEAILIFADGRVRAARGRAIDHQFLDRD